MAHTHQIPATISLKALTHRSVALIVQVAKPALTALTKTAPQTDRLDARLLDQTTATGTTSQQQRLFDITEAVRWQLPR